MAGLSKSEAPPPPLVQHSTTSLVNHGPTESFVVLSESTLGAARAQPQARAPEPKPVPPTPSAQHQIERLLRLSSLLSADGINRPLCTGCTDLVLELMSNQLQDAKSDRDRYAVFERDLNRERAGAESGEKIREDIEQLKKRELEATEKLRKTESEHEAIEAELKALEREEAELETEEQEFWQDFNQYELELIELRSTCDSVTSRCHQDKLELDQLRHTNVYKDAFCIGCEGGVATINGLRLGRLPEVPVEWVEINAAWGHTALLLQTLCRRFSMTLDGYKLIPLGSFSRIEKTKGDQTNLELFGSDDFAFARMLHNRRFDNAMVDFLECLRQVLEVAVRRNPRNKIPFRIHKDKIGEVSIKLSFSSEEAWTTALRHVLFTLKVLNGSFDSMR
ncbi:hypothetical protein CROQUDRAFT_47205 [Cronartium quercuum f. sp. fusiforme G11]|uniref:Autophagy-related protein 6 n=1 Tax=Cronartium quercuum f. sp. fusiforme G11 TaxID=708437 RepID=A0A9P6NIA9_9BASI|nr:hypothetical protein CROQUDRAFT_47205 [Cronartium quercuum f. sp. fusiforme G11]